MTDDAGDQPGAGLWRSLADVVVYAPIGLALDAQDLAPDLARRGRQHTAAARRIGEFAVKAGMRRLEDLVASMDTAPSRDGAPEERSVADAPTSAAPVAPEEPTDSATTAVDSDAEDDARGDASADLAIPGYDLLAASQVVKRLDGLDKAQLEAIRRHEEAGRGRRTILHKITRLQAG